MELPVDFDVPEGEQTVRERIGRHFEQAGYSPASTGLLEFKRGSALGSMTSFSPRKWQSKVRVRVTPIDETATSVAAVFSVNTTGQWVTDKERAAWQAEVDAFRASVSSGEVSTESVQKASAAVKGNTARAILVFLGVSLVVGLIVGLGGAILTGKSYFTSVGTVVGLLAGYAVIQRYFGVNRQ
ncbi:MAG TPA: hypothetical protein PKO09_13800 [Anaerolineae bacterium]|nr:hypothetical protein [Anaerolineae bacterium]